MKSATLEGEISETIVLRIASASGHLDLDGVPGVIRGEIFGKEESDETTVGCQAQLHSIKQDVVLYVTAHAQRDVTVLDSKTGSVTSVYRPT